MTKQQQERKLNGALITDPKHNSNEYLYLLSTPVISPVSNGRYLGNFIFYQNFTVCPGAYNERKQ